MGQWKMRKKYLELDLRRQYTKYTQQYGVYVYVFYNIYKIRGQLSWKRICDWEGKGKEDAEGKQISVAEA